MIPLNSVLERLDRFFAENNLEGAEAEGVDLVTEIQNNTVKGLGYPSMEAADKAMGEQIIKMFGTSCGMCGYYDR